MLRGSHHGGVYFVQGVDGGPIKIGFSRYPVDARLRALQCGSPVELKVVLWVKHAGQGLERLLHAQLMDDRLHGEWFTPSDEVMEVIEELRELTAISC